MDVMTLLLPEVIMPESLQKVGNSAIKCTMPT